MMYTEGAQCTANFVYTDGAGTVYVGYAAHCAGTGAATDTNGCNTQSLPLGTKVTFNEGGSLVSEGTQVGSGTLAYSSWDAMKKAGETDPNTCAYNDLALVKVDAADVSKVNPSVPFWGGPTGIDTDGTAAGDRVYTYGNSSLRAGISALSPHTGISLGDDAADGGWSHPLYTVTPGVPGDSGSAFVSADGKSAGAGATITDGRYTATKVPVGAAKVQIRVPRFAAGKPKAAKGGPGPGGPDGGQIVVGDALPDKFHNKTELTYDVKPGRQEKNWDLSTK